MAGITLEDVWKVYPDGTEAVRALDLEIADGEFVVLVGPSGCGKTTALRMVAGLEAITRGKVCIGDTVVNDVSPKDRDIAMVFQSYALYPHMSVFDNMAFGLKLQKVGKVEIDRRVRDAARILGLEELLSRKPRALSGGQRQRVAMGRAIVRHPRAFLMDEPLSNLDAKLRTQTRAEIKRLQTELRTTTVYVTHDQVEAMTMGDRVAVLRRGELQQVDPPEVLYARPANVFVAGFIGSPAMNLIDTELRGGHLAIGEARLAVPESVFAARPALRGYEGRRLIVGIRPEDLEDATLAGGAPAHRRVRAEIVLREALGSDVIVHARMDVRTATTDDVREALEVEDAPLTSELVARLSPRSSIARGDIAELVVDTTRLHFFDPEVGTGIY